MARVYYVPFSKVAVAAAQDLWELAPAADSPIVLLEIHFAQSSDMGDAAEEGLNWAVVRGNETGGSGGSAVTPRPADSGDSAANFTASVNNTTFASGGTPVSLPMGSANNRVGQDTIFTPESTIMARNSDGLLVVRLLDAPADSLTMSGYLVVAEL